MNQETKQNLNRNCCRYQDIRLPRMGLAQWTDCGQCGRHPSWDAYEKGWRCPLDGRVEPKQGCSGSGI